MTTYTNPARARQLVSRIAELNLDKLARKDLPADLVPIKELDDIYDTITLCQRLVDYDFDKVPQEYLEPLVQNLQYFIEGCESLLSIHVHTPNATQSLESTKKQIRNSAMQIRNKYVLPAVIEIVTRAGDTSLRDDIKHFQHTAKKSLDNIQRAEQSAQEILSDVQASLAVNPIKNADSEFSSAAGEARELANKWIAASLVFFVVAVGFTVFSFIHAYCNPILEPLHAVQIIASKILIVSLLTFAIIASARNYKSAKHLQAICEHRHLSLSSWERLFQTTIDDNAKDTLLVHASMAIFGPRATGYELSDPEVSQVANPLSMLKELGDSAKSS